MRLVEHPKASFSATTCYTTALDDSVLEEQMLRHPDCWTRSEVDGSVIPTAQSVALFDQNGYDLTYLEQLFARENNFGTSIHRNVMHISLRTPWLVDSDTATPTDNGAVHLNHSYLFERKAFSENALRQVLLWSRNGATPQINKLVWLRPKWGIDISVDYAGSSHAFEVLHFEWDSFMFERAEQTRQIVTRQLTSYTPERWTAVSNELIDRWSEWSALPFFEQSDWKCNFYGLPKEQFKMVCWSTIDA